MGKVCERGEVGGGKVGMQDEVRMQEEVGVQ